MDIEKKISELLIQKQQIEEEVVALREKNLRDKEIEIVGKVWRIGRYKEKKKGKEYFYFSASATLKNGQKMIRIPQELYGIEEVKALIADKM
jgi:hypothetical protein